MAVDAVEICQALPRLSAQEISNPQKKPGELGAKNPVLCYKIARHTQPGSDNHSSFGGYDEPRRV
jgi:hypothetical protein